MFGIFCGAAYSNVNPLFARAEMPIGGLTGKVNDPLQSLRASVEQDWELFAQKVAKERKVVFAMFAGLPESNVHPLFAKAQKLSV